MGQSGLTKGRGIFIGGILVVVALIGYVALDGYPPQDGDSAGAIGVADRYRAEQITEDDVQLTDAEIQYWLQKDDVQKLLSDPAFQEAAKDGNFAGILDHELAREVFLDAEWAKLWVDQEYARRLEEANYASLIRPEDKLAAIREIADDVALLGPDPRMPDFATDVEFARLFEVKQVARALLDVEFLKQAVEVVEKYGDARLNGSRPDAALASLQELAKDAAFARDYRKVTDFVNDAEIASRFKELNFVSKIFTDMEYASRLRKVALAARDRLDVDAEMLMTRPTLSYNAWARAANLSLAARPLPDWAVDAEFATRLEDKAIGQIIMDVELMQEVLDPELRNRISEVDFQMLRPEAQIASLKQWFAEDAALAARAPRVEKLILDAEFAKRYEVDYMQKIFTDFDYAKLLYEAALMGRRMEADYLMRRPEVSMMGKRQELNQISLRPEVFQAALLERLEANLASPWSLRDMVMDAEFEKFFLENDLAHRLPLDVEYMKIVAEVDAGYLIQRDRVESVAMDAEMMRRLIDVDLMGRRRVAE